MITKMAKQLLEENYKELPMITIQTSATADTRTCDCTKVSKEQLMESSVQHIDDVAKGFDFFINMLKEQAARHDHDKLSDIAGFHRDFLTNFEQTTWWDNHRKVNRHHLEQKDGVPKDVNLVDVLDMVVDCVMAGMGRSGSVRPLKIAPEVLMAAFKNTAKLLESKVVVE